MSKEGVMILFITSLISIVKRQDYQLFNEDAIVLFKNKKGNVFPLIPIVEGDSVRIQKVINTDDCESFENYEDSLSFVV